MSNSATKCDRLHSADLAADFVQRQNELRTIEIALAVLNEFVHEIAATRGLSETSQHSCGISIGDVCDK